MAQPPQPQWQVTQNMRYNCSATGAVMHTDCTLTCPTTAYSISLPGYTGLYPILSLSPLQSSTSPLLRLDHVLFPGVPKSASDQINIFVHPGKSQINMKSTKYCT